MQTELVLLAAAAILGLAHIILAAAAASKQRDLNWNVGPRDEPVQPLTGVAGRLARAQANFFETFPIFAVLVLVAYLGGSLGELSKIGAIIYLAARVIYIPLYAYGVRGLRTIVWAFSIVGILFVAAALIR